MHVGIHTYSILSSSRALRKEDQIYVGMTCSQCSTKASQLNRWMEHRSEASIREHKHCYKHLDEAQLLFMLQRCVSEHARVLLEKVGE